MPLLLLHGDNALEIGEAARAARARFHAADILSYDGASVSLATLAEASRTAGLFDPERLVVVSNLDERFKARKSGDEETEVRRLLGDIAPTTTLLLVSGELPPGNALIDAVRSAGGKAEEHRLPRRGELARWIVGRGKTRGIPIDPDAADLLAELIGSNPLMLDSEIEKLATYAGDEARVTVGMVDTLVGSVTQETIFVLVDAIATGNKPRAFQLLREQLAHASSGPIEVALYVIRMLARQVRILLRIRLAQAAGRSTGQITSDLKLSRYYADGYFRQARRFSTERLTRAFEQLAAFEYAIKSGRADAEAGLDLLVTELCG